MPDVEQNPLFLEQIIESTFDALSENESFDQETLGRLRELASSSGLTNFEHIVEALVSGDKVR